MKGTNPIKPAVARSNMNNNRTANPLPVCVILRCATTISLMTLVSDSKKLLTEVLAKLPSKSSCYYY